MSLRPREPSGDCIVIRDEMFGSPGFEIGRLVAVWMKDVRSVATHAQAVREAEAMARRLGLPLVDQSRGAAGE